MPWISRLREGDGFTIQSADGLSDVVVAIGLTKGREVRVYVQTLARVTEAAKAPLPARKRLEKLRAAAKEDAAIRRAASNARSNKRKHDARS